MEVGGGVWSAKNTPLKAVLHSTIMMSAWEANVAKKTT